MIDISEDKVDTRVKALRRQSKWIYINEGEWYVGSHGITRGNRTKCIVAPYAPELKPSKATYYFWKAPLPRYPLEFWSEILAYQIAPFCYVPAAVNWPSVLKLESGDTRIGSLGRFLIDIENDEVLQQGGDVLAKVKPSFRRKKGEDHSVQLCFLVLEALDHHSGNNYFLVPFFRQLVFDALIGNSDRHQDNWALGVRSPEGKEREFRLLQAFDNGTSFGRELSEDRIMEMNRDESRLDKYISNGKAHIRWEEHGRADNSQGKMAWQDGLLEHLGHEEIMKKILATYPELRRSFEFTLSFEESLVIESISRVCNLSRIAEVPVEIRISEAREEFFVKSILRRRDRLAQL